MQKTMRHSTSVRSAKATQRRPSLYIINLNNRAQWLDRVADAELALGHHQAAERLAHQAHELRQVAS